MAQSALNECFGPQIWVRGEIHGLKVHAKSGHVYFDLVEKSSNDSDAYIARVSCAFFRGSFVKWQSDMKAMGLDGFELNSGLEIKLRARVDLFVKEGRYQLIVSEIDPSYTLGAIAQKRARTIEQLRSEGLLDRNKKLRLSPIPLNIGLITSDGSAAYNDFTSIILPSGYSFSISLYDAHMQGNNTVPEVIRGIHILQAHERVDIIVIIRGGGAKTDLFPFDDPSLCRAIALCSKPVITGIGHEIDVSVADMVAHTYCVTPTDAARFLVSRADELHDYLLQSGQILTVCAQRMIEAARQRLANRAAILQHLGSRWTMGEESRLKTVAYAIHAKVRQYLMSGEMHLSRITAQITDRTGRSIGNCRRDLDICCLNLKHDILTMLNTRADNVESLASSLKLAIPSAVKPGLDLLDRMEHDIMLMHPLKTLMRGYSITMNSHGQAVTQSGSVEVGESITTVVHKGKIMSTVYDKEPS